MKDMVRKAGLEQEFEIASAATSTEELGNGVYPPARRMLAAHGISCEGKRARQICAADYEKYDYIIGMDTWNIRNLHRMLKDDPDGKVHKFLTFAGSERDIADPWYTGDFDATYRDMMEGCEGFLAYLRDRGEL